MKEGSGGANIMGSAEAGDLLLVGGVPVVPDDLGPTGDSGVETSDTGGGITETSNEGGSIMEVRNGGCRGRRQRARGVQAVAPLQEFGVNGMDEIGREAEGKEDGGIGGQGGWLRLQMQKEPEEEGRQGLGGRDSGRERQLGDRG